MATDPVSLYLHVPFCTLKCAYCDFNSYAKIERMVPDFLDALVREIETWGPIVAGRPVPTVFFGGGTPSMLSIEQIARIIHAVRGRFELTEDAEVTMEANPGTVDGEYFRGLLAAGVNRLSIGVQSFHDGELAAIDRIHSAEEAREAYRQARAAGLQRINLDLIYGLAGQTLVDWRDNVEEALTLGPEHLSLYALTVEEGTKLAYEIERGKVPEPDADLQAEMYSWTQERLAGAGYDQYEISNWCRPGEECRHNLVYWRNGEWLGLGPGAHSHWGGYRFADVYSPRKYVELVRAADGESGESTPLIPSIPQDEREGACAVLRAMPQVTFVDPQPLELQMADTAILSLRLNEGLDLDEFQRRFGRRAEDVFGESFAQVAAEGLLERENGSVRLTERGRYLANEVFVRLLPE